MASKTKMGKRTPLKHPPLRNPGQSLEVARRGLLDDQVMLPFIMAVFVVVFAAYEWFSQLTSEPPHPFAWTVVAAGFVAYAVLATIRFLPRLKSMQLGLDGEKSVGQYLETLRSQGYRVFHDILCQAPGRKFNIDHVIIGPQGVFAVETKTYSKPARGECKVTYAEDKILINGFEPERNAIVQARANSNWIHELLQDTTSENYQVRGVILLPGWYVEPPKDKRCPDIWILNPKALPAFIRNAPEILREEDIALASSRLTNYITHE